jgi:hypothetical protein
MKALTLIAVVVAAVATSGCVIAPDHGYYRDRDHYDRHYQDGGRYDNMRHGQEGTEGPVHGQ